MVTRAARKHKMTFAIAGLRSVQNRATEIIRELKYLSYEKWLRELGLFSWRRGISGEISSMSINT